MREAVNRERLLAFMRQLATESRAEGRVYLTGGASAVLLNWRDATVDVDVTIIPDSYAVLTAIRDLKERLNINVELASPADFIPALPGWEERSRFIAREGKLDFYHYDFYAQCLAKIERGHRKDLADVRSMLSDGLVEPQPLMELFVQIEPELLRYPAIDAADFRKRVESTVSEDR
jgi:hypothetical protein